MHEDYRLRGRPIPYSQKRSNLIFSSYAHFQTNRLNTIFLDISRAYMQRNRHKFTGLIVVIIASFRVYKIMTQTCISSIDFHSKGR